MYWYGLGCIIIILYGLLGKLKLAFLVLDVMDKIGLCFLFWGQSGENKGGANGYMVASTVLGEASWDLEVWSMGCRISLLSWIN